MTTKTQYFRPEMGSALNQLVLLAIGQFSEFLVMENSRNKHHSSPIILLQPDAVNLISVSGTGGIDYPEKMVGFDVSRNVKKKCRLADFTTHVRQRSISKRT